MLQVCDFRLATAQPVARAASLSWANGVIGRGERTVAQFPSQAFTKTIRSEMNVDLFLVIRFCSIEKYPLLRKFSRK